MMQSRNRKKRQIGGRYKKNKTRLKKVLEMKNYRDTMG